MYNIILSELIDAYGRHIIIQGKIPTAQQTLKNACLRCPLARTDANFLKLSQAAFARTKNVETKVKRERKKG